MTSLADRLAAASRDRATTAPATTDAMSGMSERRGTPETKAENDFSALKAQVHNTLLQQLGPKLYDAELTQTELEHMVKGALQEAMQAEDILLTTAERTRISQEIADDILGYGPIEPFLRDPDLTEVMVNGPNSIYIERGGRLVKVEGHFNDEAAPAPHHRQDRVRASAAASTRRAPWSTPACPTAAASTPSSRRWRSTARCSRSASSRPTRTPRTTWSRSAPTRSAPPTSSPPACKGRLNIVVSGGTGSGKTTMLNVLSSFIPTDERIVTIEDAAELQLHQDHVLRLESRPPNIEGKGAVEIRDLVRNALRMRPDRIVVGEVRDAAALDMLQAMNTGHDGSLSTVHANSPRDTLARIETMVLMAGMDLPIRAIREQVASAVDLIVHQSRLKDGSRRITHVTEVERMEGDVITLQDVFIYDHSTASTRTARPSAGCAPPGCGPSSSRSSRTRTCTSTRCSSPWTGSEAMPPSRYRRAPEPAPPRGVAGDRRPVDRVRPGVRGRRVASTTSTAAAASSASCTRSRRRHARPDLGSLKVTLDGKPVDATAVLASDATNAVRRTAVLAVDISNSMAANGKFDEAKRAAQLFIDSAPADLYIGVVTFAERRDASPRSRPRPRRADGGHQGPEAVRTPACTTA